MYLFWLRARHNCFLLQPSTRLHLPQECLDARGSFPMHADVSMFNDVTRLLQVEKGDFKILLKYLKGLQGKSRGETVAAAQEHVNELADVGEGAEDAFNRIKKKRSEKIIKMFG